MDAHVYNRRKVNKDLKEEYNVLGYTVERQEAKPIPPKRLPRNQKRLRLLGDFVSPKTMMPFFAE